jgi:hypothetical protein
MKNVHFSILHSHRRENLKSYIISEGAAILTQLQTLMNTLTENDFHGAFKRMAETLQTLQMRRRWLLQG